ncbi:MAG TPA: hypothetical protein VI542_36865, partial [Candidatus Tectomicrobia bacterium]
PSPCLPNGGKMRYARQFSKYTEKSDAETVVLVAGGQRITAIHKTSTHRRQEDDMPEHINHREQQAQLQAIDGTLYDRLVDILYV